MPRRSKHGAIIDEEKQAIREEVWALMQAERVTRFPGVKGRIPNFKGAEAAAERLTTTPWFQEASIIKCNPDAPQRPVRHHALKAGKVVYAAVPRLRQAEVFFRLDPAVLGDGALWAASSMKGAAELGVAVAVDEVERVDLIVSGCVAASPHGHRVGKGGGFADLEYALLCEAGVIDTSTPVVTTVHPLQLREELPVREHDVGLDGVVTPDDVVVCRGERAPGLLLWDRLTEEQIGAIPLLGALRAAGRG
jgi:5-formyltetrahydrofolate cyclo-ligase